jgi:hypothetical protein
VFGSQLRALAVFAEPPWPAGRLRRKARRLLAAANPASIRTHEGCATFLPSSGLSGGDLEAYRAGVPPAYREFASALEWLRERGLPQKAVEHLVFGIGRFALGARVPSSGLASPASLAEALRDPARNPDERFAAACEALSSATEAELLVIARAPAPAAVIAAQWYPRAGLVTAPYEPVPEGERWLQWWGELIAELAKAWSADPELPREEGERLMDAARNSLLLLPTPTYTTLKALLTRTVSQTGAVWDHPPVDRLLRHRYAEVSYNGLDLQVPGIENVDGKSLPLAPGEAALWLSSPGVQPAAARLSRPEFIEYLRRVSPETTICLYDGTYWFPDGDLLSGEPLIRGRPHAVLLQQRSLGVLLSLLDAAGTIAGEDAAIYSAVGSDIPGVIYFTIRPASARYPLIVAPVPGPTSDRAAKLIEDGAYPGLRWRRAEDPLELAGGDHSFMVHLTRICATFEDKQSWLEFAETLAQADDALKRIGR